MANSFSFVVGELDTASSLARLIRRSFLFCWWYVVFATMNVDFFESQLEFTAAGNPTGYQRINPLGRMGSRHNRGSPAHLIIDRDGLIRSRRPI
jgi:hypothetical protein